MYDGSSSIYDGMLLTVQHAFANYFTLITNYTYSKCITGGTDVGDLGGNTFQNPYNPASDRSNCGEDYRNNFNTSLVAKSLKKADSKREPCSAAGRSRRSSRSSRVRAFRQPPELTLRSPASMSTVPI